MLAATPIGIEKSAVKLINQMDPEIAERMPAFSGKREGKFEMKFKDKYENPLEKIL